MQNKFPIVNCVFNQMDQPIQEPGVPIKANLTFDDVKKIVPELYDIHVVSVKELNGYDDRNYYLRDENGAGYVIKIINLIDSKKPEIFEAQSLLLVHLDHHGISCPVPIKTKNDKFFEKYTLETGEHIVRVLTFIDGTIIANVTWTTELFYHIGKIAAQLNNTMESFKHSAYDNYKSMWMLESVPKILPFLGAVKDPERARLVTNIVEEFEERVLAFQKDFPRGLIHGDLNEQNIIVNQNAEGIIEFKAIIDYGDCHIGCYLYELSITMTYMMLLAKDIHAGGYVLAGYSAVRNVSDEECSLIKICVAARLCQSLVLGAYTYQQEPTNTYALATAGYGWQLLNKIYNEPDEDILQKWKAMGNANTY